MKVTGERVVSRAGGFNATWQRHVAAYVLSEPFLGDGRVLDLGCGVGHSFHRLAPREALEHLEQVQRVRPADREVRLLLARCQRALGTPERAEPSIREAQPTTRICLPTARAWHLSAMAICGSLRRAHCPAA